MGEERESGGGTLEGLSCLLLDCDAVTAHSLALKGKDSADISVKDIVGEGIGINPGSATASNFGNASGSSKKEDIAKSLFNMVGEVVGVGSSLCAQKNSMEKIVFVGRASTFPLIQEKLEKTCVMYLIKAVFPENREYATAIGTALQ